MIETAVAHIPLFRSLPMPPLVLAPNKALLEASRLRPLVHGGERATWVELAALTSLGLCAALSSALLDFNLRIPGHAILRAIVPMSFGLALVPRRHAGSVMTATALLGVLGLRALGESHGGSGALTSLLLTGPMLDLASRRARPGWRLYLAFSLAGLASNLAALTVRAATKALGWERAGGRPLLEWWSQAAGTYAACGLAAGLLSALLWFHLAAERPDPAGETSA
jgi:ABC-type Co2+ transport system permease subunit